MGIRLKSFIIAGLIFSGLAQGQTTLFEQKPIEIGNPDTRLVSFASTNPVDAEAEIPNRSYDNFSLSSDATISGLSWRGTYNGPFNPDASLRSSVDFEIEVFGNQPNGSPSLGQSFYSTSLDAGTAATNNGLGVSTTIVPNQLTRDLGVVVDYVAELPPFQLVTGDYWLSIRAKMDFPSGSDFLDPAWAWAMSQQGDSLTYNYDEDLDLGVEPGFRIDGVQCADFQLAGCDASFSLFGEFAASNLLGDFDQNNLLEATDIDLLAAEIRSASADLSFDVNGDGTVDLDDHNFWVEDIFGTLLGDADLNKTVAFADFLALSNSFGGMAGWAGGDFNASGDVLFSDFLFIARNFGLTAAATSVQNVPEPSTVLSGLLLLVMLSFRRSETSKNY